MAVLRRATKKLRDVGITDIEINKGLYGPYPNYVYRGGSIEQTSKCFATADEAVAAVISGFRPTIIKKSDEGETEITITKM